MITLDASSIIMFGKRVTLWGSFLILLLLTGRVRVAFAQMHTANVLHLSLIPNYESGQLHIVGAIEEADCADISYDWFQDAQIIPPQHPDEGLCLFQLFNQGEVVAQDGGSYQVFWPELQLNEVDELSFVIPGADIQSKEMTPQPRRGLRPFHWQLLGSDIESGLRVPFQPWQFEIDLTINTLLPTVTDNQSQTLLSGKVTISGIQDIESYRWLAQANIITQPETEMLLTVLDYVPMQSSDTFPGFVDLALSKQQIAWLQSDINTAQSPQTGQGGVVQFSIIGSIYNLPHSGSSVAQPPPPPSDFNAAPFSPSPPEGLEKSSSINNSEKLVLGIVRLAPHDTLSLQLPDHLIEEVSPPPSQKPDSNRLVYQGPAHFNIEIRHTVTGILLIKQIPIIARSFSVPLEDGLAALAQQFGIYAPFVALLTFMLTMLIVRKYGRQWQSTRPFFIIWLITGTALLYFTPAISSLLLLSLLILQPYFQWRHQGEAIVTLLLATAVLFDNISVSRYPIVLNGVEQHLNFYTPLILLCFALLSLGVIALRWRNVTKRLTESEREDDGLPVVYLPALTMGFMILATYEVINQSFLSFIILIIIVTLIQRFTRRSPNPTVTEMTHEQPLTSEPETKIGWNISLSYETGQFKLSWGDKQATAVSPPQSNEPRDKPQAAIEPSLSWLHSLNQILQRPIIIIGIIILALVALSPVTNPLNAIIFNLVTLLAISILFIILYQFLPTSVGYYKAILFIIPFIFIFLLGIGAASIPLTSPTNSTTSHFVLFLNQLGALILGRLIYYLTVPLFIGLYLEYTQQRQRGQVENLRQFLVSAKSLIPLITAVLSALAPSLFQLFTQQPIIATFADLIEQFLIISGS